MVRKCRICGNDVEKALKPVTRQVKMLLLLGQGERGFGEQW